MPTALLSDERLFRLKTLSLWSLFQLFYWWIFALLFTMVNLAAVRRNVKTYSTRYDRQMDFEKLQVGRG